jgi:hypothetical protein
MMYGESAANNKNGYNQCTNNESNLIAVSKQRQQVRMDVQLL